MGKYLSEINDNDDLRKIKVLSEIVWQNNIFDSNIENWLEGIAITQELTDDKVQAILCALSNFIYFPNILVREMLKSIFRDLYKKRMIDFIRENQGDTLSLEKLSEVFEERLTHTRFFGVGNPSESGQFLLYYFRQENKLSVNHFKDKADIFTLARKENIDKISLANKDIMCYVFIDDFCGSGDQGKDFFGQAIPLIKHEKRDVCFYYFCMVGLEDGLNNIRSLELFDAVEAVYELDNSFKVFHDSSNLLKAKDGNNYKECFKNICTEFKKHNNDSCTEFGHGNCQLCIGFEHNTPDNTIEIFRDKYPNAKFSPIFKRYDKI